MSQRGSFVTEYLYCKECFNAVKKVLFPMGDITAMTLEDQEILIIAGKIKGGYENEEFVDMEYTYIPEIEKHICHEVRIAVLADGGDSKIFTAIPKKTL